MTRSEYDKIRVEELTADLLELSLQLAPLIHRTHSDRNLCHRKSKLNRDSLFHSWIDSNVFSVDDENWENAPRKLSWMGQTWRYRSTKST